MDQDKPLPSVPDPQLQPTSKQWRSFNLTTLSIEGQNHWRRFVLHALQEEDLHDQETWADVLQAALQRLGENISLGGWLVGIRRAKALGNSQKKDGTPASKKGKEEDEISTKSSMKEKQPPPPSGQERPAQSSITDAAYDREAARKEAFEHLKSYILKPATPKPKPSAKHVVLTVAPFGSPDLSAEAEYEVLRANIGCTFSAGKFALPETYPPKQDSDSTILYGLDGWRECVQEHSDLRVVGGTFTILGVATIAEHTALVKILRLCIFFYLSLILEQHVLTDVHVAITFPKLSKAPTITAPSSVQRTLSGEDNKNKDTMSRFLSYLSNKKDNLFRRASSGMPNISPRPNRSGSLDLPLSHRPGHRPSRARGSEEHAIEPSSSRRLSFLPGLRPSFLQQFREDTAISPPPPPFEFALSLLHQYDDLLSTTPGVKLDPPVILVRLAEKEKHDPSRRLTGDERAALSSLIGWVGKPDPAKSMVGTSGFIRQQGLSVLHSEHVHVNNSSRQTTPSPMRASYTSVHTLTESTPKIAICGKSRVWVTFRFYGEHDETLGETITRLCTTAEDMCEQQDCNYLRGEHELRWIHGGIRISGSISRNPDMDTHAHEDLPRIWVSCAICMKRSSVGRMQDGTYLLSFGKYLELLIYSPTIFQLETPLCEHTTCTPQRPFSASESPDARVRFNLVHNYSFRKHMVSFILSRVEDIYEVDVPRLQIMDVPPMKRDDQNGGRPQEDRQKLREEIMNFWQGLFQHMNSLEGCFDRQEQRAQSPSQPQPQTPTQQNHDNKTLPPVPPSKFESSEDDGSETPKASPSKLPPPQSTPFTLPGSPTPKASRGSPESYPFPKESNSPSLTQSSENGPSSVANIPPAGRTPTPSDSLQHLSNMRNKFDQAERELHDELLRTPSSRLNDVRRSFFCAARGATNRLSAWETKHAANLGSHEPIPTKNDPNWWQSDCHAVPGGNFVVRENDWGSIIAFTLSSQDYQRELSDLYTPDSRPASRASQIPSAAPPSPEPPSPPNGQRSSFLSKAVPGKWFSSLSPKPDPDQEGLVWHEAESHSASITRTRKEDAREGSLLMSFPDVLRQKSTQETSSTPTSSRSGGQKPTSNVAPPSSVRAKPDVQVSMDSAGGSLSGSSGEAVDRLRHDLEGLPEGLQSKSALPSEDRGLPPAVAAHIREKKAARDVSNGRYDSVGSHNAPPVPPKDDRLTPSGSSGPSDASHDVQQPYHKSSVTSSITSSISSAFRFMAIGGEPQPLPIPKPHHGLLYASSPAIDDRPHIKYEWTVGKRLKFSCTVYYARQFDALRKRIGIEDVFLRSLSRSAQWVVEGGKSKSNFWKTADDQFVIKTLVNAWNVADLQVLMDLGPSYFRYMDATAHKPTILAKLLGFYTIEIRNLESNTTQAKADLLIMENLFYQQKISKKFDLKGIQGRRVKASATRGSSKTLFDGDWIEGQEKALSLLHPHSKVVLSEAVRNDSEFLAMSNIMDYSMLVGICEDRRTLACGLVDTIGSYTLAKTLEYKAKQGLSSKEVTVMPPAEYQQRFANAMEHYFLACPDRWTRPFDNTNVPCDYRQLPDVL